MRAWKRFECSHGDSLFRLDWIVAVCSIEIINKNTHTHSLRHSCVHIDFTLLFSDFCGAKYSTENAQLSRPLLIFFGKTATPATPAQQLLFDWRMLSKTLIDKPGLALNRGIDQ